jgi:hypothetical protein
MENLSRRSLLRLSGYLTGGLVLPLAGTKALALVNPGQAESVAVTPVAMPISDELVQFRALARSYATLRHKTHATWGHHLKQFGSEEAIVTRLLDPENQRVEAQAAAVIARPVNSWADVGALAEIAWLAAPKDRHPARNPTGQLARGHWRRHWRGQVGSDPYFVHEDDMHLSATAALIEAVLTMTGGQRFDMYADH